MARCYKARVIAVRKREDDTVVVAFIYYGSKSQNVHSDVICNSSERYEKAKMLKKGDEVFAAPDCSDIIFYFEKNSFFGRFWVRFFADLWNRLRF